MIHIGATEASARKRSMMSSWLPIRRWLRNPASGADKSAAITPRESGPRST
jgi:hypothetical protein